MKTGKKKIKKAKLSPKERKAAAKARQLAKKGDGSFPDILVVQRRGIGDDRPAFIGHPGEDLDDLVEHAEVVAIYKLRRVSKMKIIRKIER